MSFGDWWDKLGRIACPTVPPNVLARAAYEQGCTDTRATPSIKASEPVTIQGTPGGDIAEAILNARASRDEKPGEEGKCETCGHTDHFALRCRDGARFGDDGCQCIGGTGRTPGAQGKGGEG